MSKVDAILEDRRILVINKGVVTDIDIRRWIRTTTIGNFYVLNIDNVGVINCGVTDVVVMVNSDVTDEIHHLLVTVAVQTVIVGNERIMKVKIRPIKVVDISNDNSVTDERQVRLVLVVNQVCFERNLVYIRYSKNL